MAVPLKLHYFAGPGRAEVARIILSIGGVPYEDVNYTFQTFAEAKPKMPFGQVPVLELPGGKMLAQSGAIDRYVAKLAGLYPEDPLQAALADQAVFHVNDFMDLFLPTWMMAAEEKLAARQAIVAGKGKEKLEGLEKLLAGVGAGFIAGDKLSFADIAVFVIVSGVTSKQMDGVPKDLLDSYPAVKAFRNRIAQLPGVKAFYDKHNDEGRTSFRPDA